MAFPAYEVCVVMTKLEAGGSDINIAKKASLKEPSITLHEQKESRIIWFHDAHDK